MGEGGLNTLPQKLRQYLLDQPETTDDLHVVSVILKDGRVFEDVAISHCSLVAAVRGHSHVPFDAQGHSGIARHPSALGFWTGDQALLAFARFPRPPLLLTPAFRPVPEHTRS